MLLCIMLRYTIVVLLSLGLFACSKETKLLSTGVYEDVSETSAIEPDPSLQYHSITIPATQKNYQWHSSSFSLRGIAENIAISSNLSKENSYRLYRSSAMPDISKNIVIIKDTLFVLDNGSKVYAYKADDPSKILWEKSLDKANGDFIGGGIAVAGNYLAATYGDKDLVLLNSRNGDEVWRYRLSNISRSTPVIYKNRVYVVTVDNKLYCLDLEVGSVLWTYENALEEFGMLGHASIETTNGLVIIPSSSGQISAIDASNGELRWNNLLGSGIKQAYLNDIDTTPVIKNKTVYLSNYGGDLVALNLDSGETEWVKANTGGNNAIWIADDFIYSINKEKKLLAIYKDTGAVKWVHSLISAQDNKKETSDSTKFSGPVMVNGNLYICTSNGQLLMISAKTGKRLNKKSVIQDIYSPPIIAGNKVYLFSNSGYLSVLS